LHRSCHHAAGRPFLDDTAAPCSASASGASWAASIDALGRLAACSCMHASIIGGSSLGHSSGTLRGRTRAGCRMGQQAAGCTAAAHCAGLPVCQARWQSAMVGSAERSHACSRAGSGDTHGPARAVGPQSAPQLAERAAARHLARRQLPQQHAERPARPAERVGALLAAVTRAGCSPSGGPRCCNRALPIQGARARSLLLQAM